MVTTQLDSGLKCIKYLLLTITSFFMITAILLIIIGTGFFAAFEDYRHFFDLNYFTPGAMMIILGIFILFFSSFGWFGAIRQSTCMVFSFAILLLITVCFEIAAAVMAYSMEDRVMNLVGTKINSTMHEAEYNPEAAWALYTLHDMLKCCGYDGYEDWNGIQISKGAFITENPCCFSYSLDSDDNPVCSGSHLRGCLDPLKSAIHDNAINIVIAVALIAMIQFTGIIFACILGCAIRGRKTLRDMRRWHQSEALFATGYRLARTNETYGPTTY